MARKKFYKKSGNVISRKEKEQRHVQSIPISLIITFNDNKEELTFLIDSLSRISDASRFDIIICDNGMQSDFQNAINGNEILRDFFEKETIRIIRNDKQIIFTDQLSQAIRIARNDYIGVFDVKGFQ